MEEAAQARRADLAAGPYFDGYVLCSLGGGMGRSSCFLEARTEEVRVRGHHIDHSYTPEKQGGLKEIDLGGGMAMMLSYAGR